jgi:thioredoxin:protein disulfide reductase
MKTRARQFLCVGFVCVAGIAHAAREAELLEPEAAFAFSARLLDASTIEVRYAIANGYYMYRDKFRFQLDPGAGELGSARFPPGKIKNDPLFGKVETYRTALKIRLPLELATSDGKVTLTAISQGCADVGVCYPPMTSRVVLEATKSSGTANLDRASKPLSSLMKP